MTKRDSRSQTDEGASWELWHVETGELLDTTDARAMLDSWLEDAAKEDDTSYIIVERTVEGQASVLWPNGHWP